MSDKLTDDEVLNQIEMLERQSIAQNLMYEYVRQTVKYDNVLESDSV